ncbi:ATP-dependent helicase/nuclease subunit A [Arthrobacter ulcerisalmonis]|nr:UvrD-helicase domain-containing protein [Arthrobacter ulcerisalmonis]MDQ0665411.1 ATP-dependent helicase/nuclease subunit A [Arthrobacter ulcerisalmonis]
MNLLDNVTMVSASAGTGKTFHLTQVIAEKIEDGLPAAAVMATTFTKKAAGELKERIGARLLEQSGAAAARDATLAESLQRAAQQLPASLIGTVNSVCGKLLQEYAIDAGLSPALEVIGEEQLQGIFHLATDAILAEHGTDILPIARRMGTDGNGARDAQPWEETVRGIVDAARTNLLDADDLVTCAERSWRGLRELLDEPGQDDRQAWHRELIERRAQLDTLARTGIGPDGKAAKITTKGFIEQYPKVIQKIDQAVSVDDTPWEIWRGFIASAPAAPIKALFWDLRERIHEGLLSNPAFHSDVEQYIRSIFACAAECLTTYAEFKRLHGLMDFVDQETLVLELARNSQAFRASFARRISFLVVDEFQDTSPLQLELFLQLSRLVKEAVWVGDPKQSIYEFRGTDPDLMQAVVERVPTRRQLSHSWRSHQAVVDLSNAVFEPVFAKHGMAHETVHLELPEDHKGWSAGNLEAWTRPQTNDAERLRATAAGVADFLARRPGIQPCDVAVLTRSNADVDALSAALDALGIRSSRNPRKLAEAREIQLARAGMAYVSDGYDTVALTEIVALHPGHHAYGKWQQHLLSAADPAAVLEGWNTDPLLASLDALRMQAKTATPTEIFEAVVGVLDLPRLISSWSAPATRLRNLDTFRGTLEDYYERCLALRSPATLRGFLTFVGSEQQQSAENAGPDVVNVLTYHKAKGLEWPVAVMEALDKDLRFAAFGASVEQDGTLDLERPLAGRWIRFWPSPFPYSGSPLDARGKESQVALNAEERERRNMARLMYVGMTRAVETNVLTGKGNIPSLLNNLGVESLLSWSAAEEPEASGSEAGPIEDPESPGTSGTLSIDGGAAFSARVATLEPAEQAVAVPAWAARFTDAPSKQPSAVHLPSRLTASSEGSDVDKAIVFLAAELGRRLAEHGADEWGAVGSAVHAYLGTEYGSLDGGQQLDLAERIIARWKVGHLVAPELLVTSGTRLEAYLDSEFPDWIRHREAAIGWRPENRVMEGWIDLLLEGPEGYVLVDHKTYPGSDPEAHVREKYLGQMAAYRNAVLAATGKPVLRTLIHFPALGSVYEVSEA